MIYYKSYSTLQTQLLRKKICQRDSTKAISGCYCVHFLVTNAGVEVLKVRQLKSPPRFHPGLMTYLRTVNRHTHGRSGLELRRGQYFSLFSAVCAFWRSYKHHTYEAAGIDCLHEAKRRLVAVFVDESALRSVTPVFICVHCDTESDSAGFLALTA